MADGGGTGSGGDNAGNGDASEVKVRTRNIHFLLLYIFLLRIMNRLLHLYANLFPTPIAPSYFAVVRGYALWDSV